MPIILSTILALLLSFKQIKKLKMKATTVFLSFLVFSICVNSFSCAVADDAVLDVDGKKIQAGVEYYVLPVIRGSGGGLTLSSFGNETCPISVVQEQLEVEHGHPVTFTPANDNEGLNIRVSTDLNIRFSAFTICIESNVWTLQYDESIGKYIIHTNGVAGNPGLDTISNWFKIEKYEDDYKLVYCPTVCDICKVICKDVGIFIDDENERRRLALTDDEPFRVMFKEASSSTNSF